MKKNYKDFDELMAQLETIAKKQVKYYYTDFTEYDIPNLKKYNASTDRTEKHLIFIARYSGTWLIFADDIKNADSGARAIWDHYRPGGCGFSKDHPHKFFDVDLTALTIKEIKFDANGHIIQPQKKKRNKKEVAA